MQRYTELVRREGLDESERPSAERARVLDDLVNGARSLEVVWVDVIENSPVAGRTLAESALRTTAGVSVVAIGRTAELLGNPGPDEVLQPGDRVAVIGTPAQITEAERLLGCVPVGELTPHGSGGSTNHSSNASTRCACTMSSRVDHLKIVNRPSCDATSAIASR